jgi:hypothetical protein
VGGTAFTLEVNGKEYLVTARHLLNESCDQHSVKLFRDSKWVELEIRGLEFAGGNMDIAVLRVAERLTPEGLELQPTEAELVLGQDVLILGFPDHMYEDVGLHMRGLPCPLVKRGVASNLGMGDPQELLVDLLSNLGFSCGPVVFSPMNRPSVFRVAGVISGFKTYREPFMDSSGADTGMYVELNTGGWLTSFGHSLRGLSAPPLGGGIRCPRIAQLVIPPRSRRTRSLWLYP